MGYWIGWKELLPLAHLVDAAATFLSSLHGMSPTCVATRDHIRWGKTGQYTVKEGYKRLSLEPAAADRLCKKVWHPGNITKVNIFTWILMHHKLLTAKNLRKRGIVSPSRCALCNMEEETTSHIFLQCKISLKFWKSVLPPFLVLNLPDLVAQLLKD